MFITVLGGIFLAKFARTQVRLIKICHILLGLTSYLLGIFAIAYGLPKLAGVTERGRTALIIFMSIYVAYSLVGPCTTIINLFR